MGQARRRKLAASRSAALPRSGIAQAIRLAVTETAQAFRVTEGFCALHAAVGQAVLRERFGVDAAIAAGDLQRTINDRVVHSYAPKGGAVDAASGACHVWLVEAGSAALIDFDAWEEPARYAALGSPQGPWTAPRPDFYWVEPGQARDGIAGVLPDRRATAVVLQRLQGGATALFVTTAAAKALAYLDLLPL